MFQELRETIEAYKQRDPAARTSLEVLLLYPGIHATLAHRRAHWCYEHRLFFLARWISQRSRHRTGIEIHPGARIGKRLVIDHGMGIVIGETAEIGDDCLIYHGVTLGGTGKDVGKRHPTIGNNVLVSTGAKVLGPINVGDNSRVAANAVVLSDIPENSTAVGIPAKVVRVAGKKVNYVRDVDQVNVIDPVDAELARQTALLPRSEVVEKSLGAYGAIVVCPDLDTCAAIAGEIAPEHCELCVRDPYGLMPKVENAGALFLGHWSPEPLGDYLAGRRTIPICFFARGCCSMKPATASGESFRCA